jgi:hypothetical protein
MLSSVKKKISFYNRMLIFLFFKSEQIILSN